MRFAEGDSVMLARGGVEIKILAVYEIQRLYDLSNGLMAREGRLLPYVKHRGRAQRAPSIPAPRYGQR